MDSKIKVGSFISLEALNNQLGSSKRKKKKICNLEKEENSKTKKENLIVESKKENLLFIEQNKILDKKSINKEYLQFELTNNFFNKLKSVFNEKVSIQNFEKKEILEYEEDKVCSILPPFELFFDFKKEIRVKKFFDYLEIGDYLIGKFLKNKNERACFELICFDGGIKKRFIADLNVNAYLIYDNNKSIDIIKKSDSEDKYFRFCVNQIIENQIIVNFKSNPKYSLNLGKIDKKCLPVHYKKFLSFINNDKLKSEMNYENILINTNTFSNPCSVNYLTKVLQINS